MTNLKQLDAVECDTIYQEKGEFFFRKPGFRDAYGPFASEDEANEAAVRAGVIADGMDPITLMADAQADDSRTPDQKLAVAKRMYEQDLKSAPGPSERAQVKEDFESFKKAMIKAGARADADDPCWEGYHAEGMKEKDGKTVPNCIPDAAPQPLVAEDRKYWKRECRDRIQDANASIKSFEEDLKRAESKLANLGADAKPSQKQSLQADVRDYKDLIRQQRMRLKSAQETLEMVDKPNTTSEQIEAVWRKNKYADSATADTVWSKAEFTIKYLNGAGKTSTVTIREEDEKSAVDKLKSRLGSDVSSVVSVRKTGTAQEANSRRDAAVSFDKGNPEKPWSVKVGSSIKRFAFRQQAEAAARGDAEVDAAVDKYIKSSGDRAKYLALTPEEKAKVNKWLEDGYYYPEAVKKAGIFNRGDAEVDAEPTRNQRLGFGNPNASKDQLFDFLNNCAPVSDAQLAVLLQVAFGIKPAKARSVVSDFKSRADSTPTIVREGDQWIIVVTDGAEKSVFRLGVREYPTEAEALEYATTNPQYTNNKPTSALDSLMAACDSLYAKADEIGRRMDAEERYVVKGSNVSGWSVYDRIRGYNIESSHGAKSEAEYSAKLHNARKDSAAADAASFKKGDKVKNSWNGRTGVVEEVKDRDGLKMIRIGGVWFANSDYVADSAEVGEKP